MRRATCQAPPGSGSPGRSPGSRWLRASACQPCAGEYASTGCGSKFSGTPRSAAGSAGIDVHAARPDLDAAGQPAAGELGRALEDGGPHVQLDLLAHAQVVVEQVREPVARARPRLDAELEQLPARRRELDLAGLEVPLERDEAERAEAALDDAHGSV